jgi:hypothetical protein
MMARKAPCRRAAIRDIPTIPSLPTIPTSTLLPSRLRATREVMPSFRKYVYYLGNMKKRYQKRVRSIFIEECSKVAGVSGGHDQWLRKNFEICDWKP